jgi:hypothetical protein
MEIAQIAATIPGTRRRPAGGKSPGRSRITNGALLPDIVDGRSSWARRCRDLIALHLSDLGGVDNVSEAERSIVRRCAVLTTQLERLELKFAQADGDASAKDLDLYQRTAGNLRRLLEAIGLRRRTKDVTPDPLAFARSFDGDAG